MRSPTHAALITGAARRLGRAMALCLAARGYDLVLHYHASEAEARQLKHAAEGFGAEVHLLQGDLRDLAWVETLIPQAREALPHLNLLINNASAFYPRHLAETDLSTLEHFLDLHLKVPFILTRDFARHCGKGQIINLSDSQVHKYPTAYAPYILSKKALAELTALSAKSLGPQIRVNAIAPGYILPPVEGNPDEATQWQARTPLQRNGQIPDITGALESLLDNPFLTGQTLWVDGGHRL